jgi:hypothetical protein
MAAMQAVLSSLHTNFTGLARDFSICANMGMTSRFNPESFAPTRLQVSESAVDPLVCPAFLHAKQMGHLRLPHGEEISSQKPPEALVE